jgi:hypothetical protein
MAEAFDAARIRTSGEPFHIADQVDLITANLQGNFSGSQTGVVAYYSGDGSRINSQLSWFDRSGNKLGTVGEPGNFVKPAISPDGHALAVDRLDSQSGAYGIWQYDLGRGSPTRFTFEAVTGTLSVARRRQYPPVTTPATLKSIGNQPAATRRRRSSSNRLSISSPVIGHAMVAISSTIKSTPSQSMTYGLSL